MSKEDLIALLETKTVTILNYTASRQVQRHYESNSRDPTLIPSNTTYISLELAMQNRSKSPEIRINPLEGGMKACVNCSQMSSCLKLKTCQFKTTPEYLTCDYWE